MHFYINDGAPSEKLNLGIGTYGKSFTLTDPADNGVGAPISGPGKSGPYKGGTGSLSYNEVRKYVPILSMGLKHVEDHSYLYIL